MLAVSVGALVSMLAPVVPIEPVPEVKVSVPAVEMLVAATCVIAPEPLAERVTEVPLTLAPKPIEPLAVVERDNVPLAVIAPEVVSPALLDTETVLPAEVPLPILRAAPPEPAQVTLPVVLKVKLVVEPVRVVIAPEPEVRFKLVAVIEPDV